MVEKTEHIKELREAYETQDNRATAYPIFVTVQEKHCVGVIHPDYSVCCPYGDGTEETVYTHPDLEGTYDSEDEIFKRE